VLGGVPAAACGHNNSVTRIGVVSDTHLPRFGRELPSALERGLRRARVDRILHLGDMTDLLAVPLFEAIAPFDAVAGNNDGAEIRARFGRSKILTVEGVRVGMVHGDGKGRSTKDRALAAFAPGDVDVVWVYGYGFPPWRGGPLRWADAVGLRAIVDDLLRFERIHGEGVTILLVEQNALRALEIADRAYVVETGRILLSGTGAALRRNPDVQKAYLGG